MDSIETEVNSLYSQNSHSARIEALKEANKASVSGFISKGKYDPEKVVKLAMRFEEYILNGK